MISLKVLMLLFALFLVNSAKAVSSLSSSCSKGPEMTCRSLQRGDDVIELLPKRLPRDHPIARLPQAAGKENFICSIPACLSKPCFNEGTCRESVDGFICECPHFAYGVQCENVDECASDPCNHNGTCTDDINAFHCNCTHGWTGITCSDIDECASDPCENGATCVDDIDSFNCTCAPGFADSTCSTDIDECTSDPCYNNGTCVDEIDGFQCSCARGWTGDFCGEIDDCVDEPCVNGGTCTDGVGEFICSCASGFTGVNCSTEIDECESNPCANNGTCTDDVNAFHCNCTFGWAGSTCSGNDDCVSNPCMNNGTCTDGDNTYHCSCQPDYHRKNCSTKFPIDCEEIVVAGHRSSGVYSIYISGNGTSTPVYCDMETDGGGWLVIYRRLLNANGNLDFYRDWSTYQAGFGNVTGEFWLGNDNLHALASQKEYTLRMDFENLDGTKTYATYSTFNVKGADDKYKLSVSGFSGSETVDYMELSNGMRFSTHDNENDKCYLPCTQRLQGGWWFSHCDDSYFNSGNYWVGLVQSAEMKIYPAN